MTNDIHHLKVNQTQKFVTFIGNKTKKTELMNIVSPRAHVHYVVTEYGTANLYGQSLRRRARALIQIAHPGHRVELEEAALQRFTSLRFQFNFSASLS